MSEKSCFVFNIITLSPDFFQSFLKEGLVRRAQEKGIVKINLFNLRDFTKDKHRVVDDYTFGGGTGMVLKPEPIFNAVETICKMQEDKSYILLTSPCGVLFSQEKAKEYSQKKNITIICGKYEGVDYRVVEYLIDEEVSIGDYVLSCGEIPSTVIIDAVVRLLPGALSKEEATKEESFSYFLLEYPQYTRPRNFRGWMVPEVLLSGNHKEIERWRRVASLKRTIKQRPDLISKINLDKEDKKIINNWREKSE